MKRYSQRFLYSLVILSLLVAKNPFDHAALAALSPDDAIKKEKKNISQAFQGRANGPQGIYAKDWNKMHGVPEKLDFALFSRMKEKKEDEDIRIIIYFKDQTPLKENGLNLKPRKERGKYVATTTATSYMDTGLAETTYQYKVRAVANTNHYSGFSNTAGVTLVN